MDTLGLLSIFVGFSILIFVTYRGWSIYLASFLGAVATVWLAGLPLTETLTEQYLGGLGSIVSSLLGMFLFSSVMAKLYASSGAALSIAYTLQHLFLSRVTAAAQRRRMSLLLVILASSVICYGGINAAVVIITIYPIAISIFKSNNIPLRFAPSVILSGCVTFALSGPGSPQPTNLIPSTLLGTSPTSGLLPGIVGMIVEIFVTLFVLDKMISRAQARGEQFEPASTACTLPALEKDTPPFFISLLPLATLFVLFNLMHLDILFCTLTGAALSVFLFAPYMARKDIRKCINTGLSDSLVPVGSIGAVFGFASCIQCVPAFQAVIDAVTRWSGPPFLLCIVSVALLCALTGGSTTGQSIALPIVAPLLQAQGMPAAIIHRIAAFSATTLDSLPYSGTILMTINHAGLKMKDAYPAIFVSTTLATSAASLVVAALLYFLPFLA